MSCGAYEDAADRFERALEQCDAIGAPAQKAYAQREYARLLLRRGRSGDRARAARLLRDAAGTCGRRGFHGLAVQVAALDATLPPSV